MGSVTLNDTQATHTITRKSTAKNLTMTHGAKRRIDPNACNNVLSGFKKLLGRDYVRESRKRNPRDVRFALFKGAMKELLSRPNGVGDLLLEYASPQELKQFFGNLVVTLLLHTILDLNDPRQFKNGLSLKNVVRKCVGTDKEPYVIETLNILDQLSQSNC